MAKVSFPSGMQLSGRLGNLVICQRNGGMYVRTRVKPANPRSKEQQAGRRRFSEAVEAWKELGEDDKESYRERARWLGRSGYHLFLSERLRGE